MSEPVTIPLWLALIFAAITLWLLISRLLLPTVRWYFRRQANRLIDRLNRNLRERNLQLRIPPITLTQRQVIIDRLLYDPRIARAVAEHCEATGEPRTVAMNRVQQYAREIVPAFNAYLYFRVGTWLARKLVRMVYRVRMSWADEAAVSNLDENASLVFVVNHRSNMDYVLVAYLAMSRTVLSYAVGEWARVWPLQQMIRSVGAYFVRRGSGNQLYRRVLERYVQIAVEGGVTQAIFPEGGLSRDGRLREPRVGLLDYMLRDFDPYGARDIVFLPVAVNYDRVLEDRTLLADRDANTPRQSGWSAMVQALRFLLHNLRLGLRGRWERFGYACASFGRPISLKAYLAAAGWDPRDVSVPDRSDRVLELARRLMGEVGQLVPVLPVSLLATLWHENPEAVLELAEIRARTRELERRLVQAHPRVYLPRQSDEAALETGLGMLVNRRIVLAEDGLYRANPEERDILRYYANVIAHLRRDESLPAAAAPPRAAARGASRAPV